MIKWLLSFLILLYSNVAIAAPYLGDYKEDETVHFIWHTNDSDGASVTRATDGTVSVYKDNGTSQSTAGVTDTEDFDGLTGIHACTIDLSSDAFYATGANYTVVLSAATIDSQTVNAVLAHFSIENRFNEVDVTYIAGDAVQDNGDGRLEVNVEEWNDTAVNADTAGYPSVTIKDGTGTGELDTDSGTVLLRSATETQIDNIETDTAAMDTSTELRTLLTGSDTALSTLTTSEVNAQVSDVIKTDTISEMSQGAPPGSPTMEQAVNYLYKAWRNKNMTDSSTIEIYDDAGTTVLFKSPISDNGTDFTKGEYVTGP